MKQTQIDLLIELVRKERMRLTFALTAWNITEDEMRELNQERDLCTATLKSLTGVSDMKEVVKKLYDGQMSTTLNNVQIGEVVSMGYDKRDLGICRYIDCGDDGERDFVVFNNLKKDNTNGKLYKSFNRFSKVNVRWEEDFKHIEWKRG